MNADDIENINKKTKNRNKKYVVIKIIGLAIEILSFIWLIGTIYFADIKTIKGAIHTIRYVNETMADNILSIIACIVLCGLGIVCAIFGFLVIFNIGNLIYDYADKKQIENAESMAEVFKSMSNMFPVNEQLNSTEDNNIEKDGIE